MRSPNAVVGERLQRIDGCLLGSRVHVENDSVRANRECRAADGRHEGSPKRRVTRIHEHGQMRQFLGGRDDLQIDDETRRRHMCVRRHDASFAERDVFGAMVEKIFGGAEPVSKTGPEMPLQEHGLGRTSRPLRAG